jgi:hypothetical protein
MQPVPFVPPPIHQRSWQRRLLCRYSVTWWWFLVPLFTLGFATFAMVAYATVRLSKHRSRRFLQANVAAVAVYFVVTAAYFTFVPALDPNSALYDLLMSITMLLTWCVGTAHILVLQRLAGREDARQAAWSTASKDPAVAAAHWRIQRRKEARDLTVHNPALAVELGIGRPDLPHRQYVDGGLVDLNHLPVDWLVRELEVTPAQAAEVVAEREQRGGFTTPDEIILRCATISPDRFDVIRDRLVALPR